MTRFGLTTSLAVVAIAAAIASCSDNNSPSAPGTPSDATTVTATSALQGGGWNLVTEKASKGMEKIQVCHTGDGSHYVQLSLPEAGAAAHLGNSTTGKGGHAGDFRVSSNTPCPPPPSAQGMVQVCKVAGSGITVGTNFNFSLIAGSDNKSVTVAAGAGPTGTCVNAGTYPVGTTVQVQEAPQTGVSTSAITVAPTGAQQGSSDLPNRTASIVVGTGTTTLTFTNTTGTTATGTLVLCKVAGTGINVGANYTFSAGGQNVTVAAGAAPNGTCSAPITVAAGALNVTENAVTGSVVQAITGTPTPTNVSTSSRSATIQITAGQQATMTFTNVAAGGSTLGSLVVCKVAGTGVTAGTNFTFNVGDQSFNVAAGAGPTGTCSAAMPMGVGNLTVTENAVTGVGLTSVTAMQGTTNVLVSSDLSSRSATATITAGQTTTVTFTNSAVSTTSGSLKICNIAGSGVGQGVWFSFTYGTQSVNVLTGTAPTGACSALISVPAGPITVTEGAFLGTSVSSITGTPTPTNINLDNRSATTLITAGQTSTITFTNVSP